MPNFLPLLSRIHPLKTINKTFVKREDELSCTICGSKLRKYSSLIPYLLENQYKQALLCGSFNSNHLLGASQLLIENDITPIVFALKPQSGNFVGNAALLKCLLQDENIYWIDRKKWDLVEEEMKNYQAKNAFIKTHLIPEGAFMKESLKGAFSLCLDILRNEQENSLKFDNLFVDSGSGMTAITLILGMHFLKNPCHIHVILMADTFEIFRKKLQKMQLEFQEIFKCSISEPINYTLYYPDHAKSFGSVSKENLKFIKDFASVEGFFIDPIYNVKLFRKSKSIIVNNNYHTHQLIIHSGGTFSLSGFLDKIVI